jgi:hypothetical protein
VGHSRNICAQTADEQVCRSTSSALDTASTWLQRALLHVQGVTLLACLLADSFVTYCLPLPFPAIVCMQVLMLAAANCVLSCTDSATQEVKTSCVASYNELLLPSACIDVHRHADSQYVCGILSVQLFHRVYLLAMLMLGTAELYLLYAIGTPKARCAPATRDLQRRKGKQTHG